MFSQAKGENWAATAGYRSKFSRVIPFRPLDPDNKTAHYNPIWEIPDSPSEAFSWADTTGGHGGGGGAGGGSQAHQRSGQNTSRELGPEDSRTLNNTSKPTFQGATKFDTATQSNVNMTRKEFYDEKRDQGKNIGNAVDPY